MVLGWLIGQAVKEISLAVDPLTLTVRKEKYKSLDVFGLYVKGSFKIPWARGGLMYLVNLYEVGEEEKPVICQIDGLNNDGVFQWVSDPINSETGAYQVKTPTNVINIPIDGLIFSRKGELSLRFELKLITFDNKLNASVIKETFVIQSFANKKNGYQDMIENQRVFNDNAVELANVLINIDGEASKSELKVLNKWIKDHISNEERRTHLLEEVKKFSKKNYKPDTLRNKAKAAITEIDKVSEASDKIALMNLLHDISIADGERDDVEHKLIQAVISKLGIDQEKYAKLFSKSVNLSESTSESELETLVGIESSMSVTEKIAQLKKAFKEWNSKITSPNAIEATNAKRVLDFISKKRNQLENA